MRQRVLFVVVAAVAMTFAWPDYNRPVVRSKDIADHVAGQVIIQLSQSQRGLVRLTKSAGVALFGIPALDELSRKWHVDDAEPLLVSLHPTDIQRKYGLDLQYIVQFGANQDIAPVMADYKALAEVELACPNNVRHFCDAPNDPNYASQWHLQKIGAPWAWTIAKGETTVLNAPLDNGVDLDHPDIKANLWINDSEDINHNHQFDTLWSPDGDLDGVDQDADNFFDDVVGYDFMGGDPIPQCDSGDDHGTHCWGISNAVTNNGIGVAGAAWNSRTIAVRCGHGTGVYTAPVIQALSYLTQHNIWAVSMSFGDTGAGAYNAAESVACQAAWDAGAVLFGAAGNDYARVKGYPACYPHVENVAASDQSDKKTDFSNYGPWVDITAPGLNIYSTVPRLEGSYALMSGTSMATPLVAGVASWMKSWNPSLTNQQALDMMHVACDTMPDSLFRAGELGAGRVSMANLVLPIYWCDLKLTSWRFNDASGNNNGRPDPGETVSLIVTYHNTTGYRTATGVFATLACSDTNVKITRDTARFVDIPGGDSANCSTDSFVITVPASVPPQKLGFYVTAHATPNPTYPLTIFTVKCGEPHVLIVDDDKGAGYQSYYTGACDSNFVLYDTFSVLNSGSPTAETLKHYPVVVWFCGNDSTSTLTSTDEANLKSYLDNGGNLLLAGQNIAQDVAGDSFLTNYLHAQFVTPATGQVYVIGKAGDPITSHGPSAQDTMVLGGGGGANNSTSADGIRPLGGAVGCGTYKGYSDTTVQAVIRYSGSYKVVLFSCAFEAIDHQVSRYLQKWTLMRRILLYFGEGIPPAVAQQTRQPEVKPYVLKVSPSPTRGRATVEFIAPISGLIELKTFATNGRLVQSQTRNATMGQRLSFTLDGAKLPTGTYLVQVKTPAGLYAQKIAVLK
ncbi:MAG TPA: S8 family serine peptidase [bacterium]|nr:S8 family serine peptidase [bacterium]